MKSSAGCDLTADTNVMNPCVCKYGKYGKRGERVVIDMNYLRRQVTVLEVFVQSHDAKMLALQLICR